MEQGRCLAEELEALRDRLQLHSQILPHFCEAVGRMVCSDWYIQHPSEFAHWSWWRIYGVSLDLKLPYLPFPPQFSRLKVACLSSEDKSVSSLCCTWNTAVCSTSCSTLIKSLVFFTVLIIHYRIGVFSYNLFLRKEFFNNVITSLRAGPWYYVCDSHLHNAHY